MDHNSDPAPSAEGDGGGATKVELSVDEIIEQHVGSLGWAQIMHVLLVSVAWVFDAQSALVTIFSDGQPKWRCTGPGGCSGPSACGGGGAWEWVAGNNSSIIAEWSLICHRKFMASVPASLFFIGSLLGSAFHGRLADKTLGRKKTILLSCILISVTAFLTSFSSNIWVYAFLRFCCGFARSGVGICCLVLATEIVGRRWRGQVSQYGFFFFTVGFISMPIIAYPARYSWRKIYRIVSLFPLAYSVILLPFVSESPRWLAVTGKQKQAMDVLNKLAARNGRALPSNLCIANPNPNPNPNPEMNLTVAPIPRRGMNLWTATWARKRLMTIMITGFGVGFVYYGVQLNVENLNVNVYLTVGVNALMEIPAVLAGSALLGFTGRREAFTSSAVLAGVSCLLCILFVKRGGRANWGQLAIESMGFMAVSVAFDVLYVYCVEMFPTKVRNLAVSMLRQTLMLGAAVAPLLVAVGRMSPSLSFVVFGVLSIVSVAPMLWLPETRNSPLYETLEEQENAEKQLEADAAAAGEEAELTRF